MIAGVPLPRGSGRGARIKRNLVRGLDASLGPDERLIVHYDSEQTPCRHVTHQLQGVDCTVVAVSPKKPRRSADNQPLYEAARCLTCGAMWDPRKIGDQE